MTMDDADRKTPYWPKAAASMAVFRGSLVLIAERGKGPFTGMWSLPGGHIEPGETAAQAALREVAEETGITAHLVGLADVHDVIRKDAQGRIEVHYVLTVFYGTWLSGEPVGQSDISSARFVPLDALASYKLTTGASRLIGIAAARLGIDMPCHSETKCGL